MFLLEVCQAFKKNKVSYAIVGGYAVALHGAVRGTVDIDLILEVSVKNFEKAEKVLNDLQLVSRIPVQAKEVVTFRKEYIENRNLIAWSFVDPKMRSRIVDLILVWDLKDVKTITKHILGIPVEVLGIPDLIKMKKESGRPQDFADVEVLEEIWKDS